MQCVNTIKSPRLRQGDRISDISKMCFYVGNVMRHKKSLSSNEKYTQTVVKILALLLFHKR